MSAIFMQTLWESLHRRVALAMLVVATIAAGMQFSIRFITQNGKLWVLSGKNSFPAETYVTNHFRLMFLVTTGPWLLLAIFAVAPLLTSHLEKGWAELIFAKGIARWQVVTARLAGSLAVFLILLTVQAIVPCWYLAYRSGVEFRPFALSMAAIAFSFSSLISIMLLTSSTQAASPAPMIGVAFLQAMLSGVLYHRVQYFYGVITWKWAQWLLDWCYRLLPKNSELIDIATSHYTPRIVWTGWWPVWSTAVFMAVTCAWAYWRFQRKAL